jgi:hypothetical protein
MIVLNLSRMFANSLELFAGSANVASIYWRWPSSNCISTGRQALDQLAMSGHFPLIQNATLVMSVQTDRQHYNMHLSVSTADRHDEENSEQEEPGTAWW